MTRTHRLPRWGQLLVMALAAVAPAFAQGGRASDAMPAHGAHSPDMQVFHQLFAHRTEITRHVVGREDGVETVTESMNPEVTRLLQTHVESMLARVKEGRPIHRRDPLFAELFRHADRIVATHELTPHGVRVVETSYDAYVVQLIRAHADTVSAFLANGHSEMMKDHPVPLR